MRRLTATSQTMATRRAIVALHAVKGETGA